MGARDLYGTGLFLRGLAVIGLLAAGCGGKKGGTDAGPQTDAGMVATDGSSGTDGGPTPDSSTMSGNHSFDTATSIMLDASAATHGALADASTAKDYYKFTGMAGDRITVLAIAQGLASMPTGFDPTIVDTVVTLYDSSQTAIAQDDDAWPRTSTDSQVFTVLPADGDYYVAVESCASAFGSSVCGDPSTVTTFDYQLVVLHANKLTAPEVNAGTSQDGTTGMAVTVPYAIPSGNSAGQYGLYTIDGTFAAAGETHVFSFTPPADTMVDSTQRARAEFWVQPIGANNGDGSTANVTVWVTDMGGTTILAQADESNYTDFDNATNGPIDLSVPVTLGQTYYLFVQSDATTSAPTTDFYFMEHFVGSYYYGQLEAETGTPAMPGTPGSNDTILTAETLMTPSGATTGDYFVDGSLGDGSLSVPTDIDWFEVDPPTGVTTVSLYCAAERAGSGLRGLTAALYTKDMTTMMPVAIAGASGTEAADAVFAVNGITVPSGTTQAFLKVTATGQDGTVTGSYYHCTVAFSTM